MKRFLAASAADRIAGVPDPSIIVRLAQSPADFADAKIMIEEYAAYLGEDLCFQSFGEEMATFPRFYECIFIARAGGEAAGVVGMMQRGARRCEMKRLFVRPAFQKTGLGRRLCIAVIEEARRRGYETMLLDTLERLTAAVALYHDLGFTDARRYYDNPLPGVLYRALALADCRAGVQTALGSSGMRSV